MNSQIKQEFIGAQNLKLNLGGGKTRIDGFINLDIVPLPTVDIVCNINEGIPLEDNSVNEIYASHFFEHINDTAALMKEIYRVCAPGAIVKIKSPYFKSNGAFKDPTHVSFFTENTFDYFDQNNIEKGILPDYGLNVNFKVEKIAYLWSSHWLRFLPFKKVFFLRYFWNIARSIYYEIRVIKY